MMVSAGNRSLGARVESALTVTARCRAFSFIQRRDRMGRVSGGLSEIYKQIEIPRPWEEELETFNFKS